MWHYTSKKIFHLFHFKVCYYFSKKAFVEWDHLQLWWTASWAALGVSEKSEMRRLNLLARRVAGLWRWWSSSGASAAQPSSGVQPGRQTQLWPWWSPARSHSCRASLQLPHFSSRHIYMLLLPFYMDFDQQLHRKLCDSSSFLCAKWPLASCFLWMFTISHVCVSMFVHVVVIPALIV